MRCRGARTAITDRRLGLLSEAREAEMRTHLAECERCAEEELHESVIARDLAHAVLRVLDDPPRANQLSANARRRIAACFSAERAARKLLRVYDCVLAR